MKKKLFIIFSVFVFAFIFSSFTCCNSTKNVSTKTNDTIYVETVRVDTLIVVNHSEVDSLTKCLLQARDSIKLYRDSIPYQDYINARRIEKINYYINICERKPTNKKFFYGWIKRTMTE